MRQPSNRQSAIGNRKPEIKNPQSKIPNQKSLLALLLALLLFAPLAQADVTISNLAVAQQPGSKLMRITYDVAGGTSGVVNVSLAVRDAGAPVAATNLTGDFGAGVATGTGKAIVWNAEADWNGNVATLNYALTASEDAGVPEPPPGPENIMVFVEGGTLPDIGNGTLNVASFYIGKYEVTCGEWQTVRTWAATNGYDMNAGAGTATNYPVHSVNWYHVVKFCNARSEMEGRTPVYTVGGAVYRSGENNDVAVNAAASGYRLPTDAEWEYAARGGTQSQVYTYSGGNDVNTVAWYYDNSGGSIHAVGTKAENELGLHDMSGNVWEWCFDWLPSYVGSDRVIRGGGWGGLASYCRVAYRHDYYPGGGWSYVGFRAVLPPSQP